ncbi:TolC family protein, partial [Candidatus Aminicenantes bacterium AC-334-E05]|nr:TolC family protein [Candidatus Aminicenantes bacterium AC-334-E05]
ISLALKFNPELISLRKQIGIAEARIIQSRLWPNPHIEFEAEDIPRENLGFQKSKNIVSLSQEVLIGGKIALRTKVAQIEKEIVALKYEEKFREVIAEIKKAFYGVLATQQKVEVARRTVEIAQSLFDSIKKRFDAGVAPQTELIKARIELERAKVKLFNAKAKFSIAEKRLKTIIGLPKLKIKEYRGRLRDSFPKLLKEDLVKIVLKTHPGLLAQKKEKELAQLKLKLAKVQRIPDIEFRVGYGKDTLVKEDIAEFSIGIPIPIFNLNQGKIIEALLNIRKAETDYKARENDILLELDEKLTVFSRTLNQIKKYQEIILPEAKKSLDLVRKGFEQGKLSYLDLLDAQRTLAETQEIYIEVIESLNDSAAELEKLIGRALIEIGEDRRNP